mmetsp:Transcript_5720/g.13818  ORF Transcript_5720/g.13818 Transcript_5720/m.13818 type:complete len:295 (-) Transcript_5720:227-1111(-)
MRVARRVRGGAAARQAARGVWARQADARAAGRRRVHRHGRHRWAGAARRQAAHAPRRAQAPPRLPLWPRATRLTRRAGGAPADCPRRPRAVRHGTAPRCARAALRRVGRRALRAEWRAALRGHRGQGPGGGPAPRAHLRGLRTQGRRRVAPVPGDDHGGGRLYGALLVGRRRAGQRGAERLRHGQRLPRRARGGRGRRWTDHVQHAAPADRGGGHGCHAPERAADGLPRHGHHRSDHLPQLPLGGARAGGRADRPARAGAAAVGADRAARVRLRRPRARSHRAARGGRRRRARR